MADYPPPTQQLPDFNPAVFRTNDVPLTIAEAENYFLSFPTAQGTENLASVNVSGTLTITRDAHNLGFGYQALSSAVEGTAIDNTAFGYQALNALTIGDSNSAFGDLAFKNLGTNANNKRNTAVGHQTGLFLTEGQDNTFVGFDCGSGVSGRTGSYYNTGVGSKVLDNIGNGTLRNTAVGMECLNGLTLGNDNTAIGFQAGISLTTGNFNTFLGSCNTSVPAVTNSTGIGYGASVTASNQIVLGTTTETVRYNKLSPLYTTLPFTAQDVGYTDTGVITMVAGAGPTDIGTIASVPAGVWLVSFFITVASASATYLSLRDATGGGGTEYTRAYEVADTYAGTAVIPITTGTKSIVIRQTGASVAGAGTQRWSITRIA